jgi:nucleoside-diphosphate-sugar epimerase
VVKTVLVTGASGFVGSQTIEELIERGYTVHALTHPAWPIVEEGGEAVVWHSGDLLDEDYRRSLIDEVKPSHLLHAAWYDEHGKYWASTENIRWMDASSDLVEKFADAGGQRVVVTGTSAEYDWSSGRFNELTTPIKPDTVYGHSKNTLHERLVTLSAAKGLSLGWGRMFFYYGPREQRERFVPSVIIPLLRGQQALCTHGRQVRDYLHVSDAGRAFAQLLDSEVEGPVNVASGDPVEMQDIIFKIADILGKRDMVDLGALPSREGEPLMFVGDVVRLTEEVGWSPRVTLDEGLRLAVDWWSKNLDVTAP